MYAILSYFCRETPLPERPSAANSYYNPLAVCVHPPVPTSGDLHEQNKSLKKKNAQRGARARNLPIGERTLYR